MASPSSPKCIIDELKMKPFHRMPYFEKQYVVNKGRPCPPLPGLTSEHIDKKNQYIRHFNVSSYERLQWLAGCAEVNKLFCWWCLLFSSERSPWNSEGFSNMNTFHKSWQKHDNSKAHIQAFLDFKCFGRSRNPTQQDEQETISISKHNAMVRKNREILKRLIDVTLFLVKQELPFGWYLESENAKNHGNYSRELVQLLSSYDNVLSEHLENSTMFKDTTGRIQNDLMDATSTVLLDHIKAEIEESLCVSILIDETSNISNVSQLSTALRYVDSSGRPHERFVGFANVSADKTSDALFRHVEEIVDRFKIQGKLVALTYDGAAVLSGEIFSLQFLVRQKYPLALFVHCYSHSLNPILQQACMNMKECRIFFQTLSSMAALFLSSQKNCEALRMTVNRTMDPKVAPKHWNFTTKMVNTVFEFRDGVLAFFEEIIDDLCQWDNDTIVKAQGYLHLLRDNQSLFLLYVFNKIFAYTDGLDDILQTQYLNVTHCMDRVHQVIQQIQNERENFEGNHKSYLQTINVIPTPEPSTTSSAEAIRPNKNWNQEKLFREIMDTVLIQLQSRLQDLANEKLHFLTLLNPLKYPQYKNSFPENELKFVCKEYMGFFDTARLKNELVVFYSFAEFQSKSPLELLHLLKIAEIDVGFREIFKLVTLILTIPSTFASVDRSFPAIKRIQSYQRSTQLQERQSSLSLITIEKQLLVELQDTPDFHENVLDQYLQHDDRIELIYK